MYKIEDLQAQDFGEVGEVVITKDDTLFMKVRLQGHGPYYGPWGSIIQTSQLSMELPSFVEEQVLILKDNDSYLLYCKE